LYFSSLTPNKLPLHPRVLPWILSGGTQSIWKSSDPRLYQHLSSQSSPARGLCSTTPYPPIPGRPHRSCLPGKLHLTPHASALMLLPPCSPPGLLLLHFLVSTLRKNPSPSHLLSSASPGDCKHLNNRPGLLNSASDIALLGIGDLQGLRQQNLEQSPGVSAVLLVCTSCNQLNCIEVKLFHK
jgi:hypothetical protein